MNLLSFLRRNLSFFAFIICLFAFRWSFADQYLVPSGSMEPTIHIGDRIVVDKIAYRLKIPFTNIVLREMAEPQRGDIIVFDNPKSGICMVKRLIGLPGDHVEIVNGFVAINGKWLEGDEVGMTRLNSSDASEVFYQERVGNVVAKVKRLPHRENRGRYEFVILPNEYFAMGDNRDNSADSRSWGLLSKKDLKGKAFAVFFNLSFKSFLPSIEWDRIGRVLNRRVPSA